MIEAGAMKSLHRGCRFKRSTSEQIEHQMVSAEWITNSNFSEADFWELGRFHLSDKRGGLNGSTQHHLESLLAGVSTAKVVRER